MSSHMIRFKLSVEHAAELLADAARQANRASNAAVRCWQRWHEDNPSWMPTAKVSKKGKAAIKPDGTPYLEHASGPLELGRQMYAVARAQSPELNSQIAASSVARVWENLRSKTPYDHPGSARYRWRAVLDYEISVPAYRADAIPLHNRIMRLVCDDSGWRLLVSLWSKQAGKPCGIVLPLETAGLTAGQKLILRRVAGRHQGWAHQDSKLVAKEGRGGRIEWYLHLCYRRPELAKLNQENQATLWPAPPEWNHLFALEMPDGSIRRIGQLIPFEAEYRRFILRCKAIQYRHRDGAAKGRGRRKVLARIKPLGRAMRDLTDRVRKLAIADVLTALKQQDIGTLVWHEPSRGLRDRLGVAQRGLPWDWTAFASGLAFRLQLFGGKLESGGKNRVMLADHKVKFGWGQSEPETVEAV